MYLLKKQIINRIKKKRKQGIELSHSDIEWLIEQAEEVAKCEAAGIPELGGSMYVAEVLKLVDENRDFRKLLWEMSYRIREELE